jgi:CrcB protein
VYQLRAKIGRLLIRCLFVLAGGGVGSLLRYLAALAVNEHYDGRFPLATFLINITGSFIIGLLLVLLDREDLLHPNLRPLLVTGFVGGYTTFSTFEWEIFALGRSAPSMALLYGISSVLVGLAACWAGASIGRRV